LNLPAGMVFIASPDHGHHTMVTRYPSLILPGRKSEIPKKSSRDEAL
jgi:hypothetical protein